MTSHLPKKRQSVKPSRAVWIGLGAVALVLLAVWVAVGIASHGAGQCPAGSSSTSRCE
jgi:hypothetical protein